jgi:hypothetical protein
MIQPRYSAVRPVSARYWQDKPASAALVGAVWVVHVNVPILVKAIAVSAEMQLRGKVTAKAM